MKIQTRYYYEKVWRQTSEAEVLKIIIEEIGDADPQGTLHYIKEAISSGKSITIGDCKLRKEED